MTVILPITCVGLLLMPRGSTCCKAKHGDSCNASSETILSSFIFAKTSRIEYRMASIVEEVECRIISDEYSTPYISCLKLGHDIVEFNPSLFVK